MITAAFGSPVVPEVYMYNNLSTITLTNLQIPQGHWYLQNLTLYIYSTDISTVKKQTNYNDHDQTTATKHKCD